MVNILAINDSLKMVRIADDVHKRLADIGRYGESMSDIIKRILDEHDNLENLGKPIKK